MQRYLLAALIFALVVVPASVRSASLGAERLPEELAEAVARDGMVERIFLEIAGKTQGFTEDEEWALAEALVAAAEVESLDPYLLLAVVRVESSLVRGQRSSVGALGLMQVRPSTARAFAERAGVEWEGAATLFSPEHNIRIGASYLSHLLRRFKGNTALALTAYCHGPTRVRQLLREQGRLDADRLRYSRKVHKLWEQYRGRDSAPTPIT